MLLSLWNRLFSSSLPGVVWCVNFALFLFPATNCTFESGQCNWTPGVESNYEWKQRQGPIPGNTFGPDVDHTLGSAAGILPSVSALKTVSATTFCV